MEFPFCPLSSRERQRDLTRERIFDAALAEFRREGFANTSVARIAKRAGVSRPSFYAHFPTKDHVLLTLQWRYALDIVERLKGSRSLREAMHACLDGMMEAQRRLDAPDLFRDMANAYMRWPRELLQDGQSFPLTAELEGHFVAGAESGELRSGLDPVLASQLYMKGVFGYLISTDTSPRKLRADLETFIPLFLERRPA